MMTRRVMLSLIAGGAATALGGCGLFDRRSSYRFRMTVEADTPQGVRRGSGVLQVNAVKSVALTAHEHAGGAGITGEAVVLYLSGGPVFVLLTIGDGKPLLATRVTAALNPRVGPIDSSSFIGAVATLAESSQAVHAELPQPDWPMIVRFRDIDDPTSVVRVDPAAFGINRILVETTVERPTIAIDRDLKWLRRLKGGYLHGGFSSRGAPLGLSGDAFNTDSAK